MRVGIIGAGPAGMTAAYLLARKGVSVELFEASDCVGGMARSFPLWGQTVDVGPHRFFSKDDRVNSLWREVVGNDFRMVQRLTRIFYKNQFYSYPLKPFDSLTKLGIRESASCLTSYLKQKAFGQTKELETFEAWVTDRFGKRLYEIFFKTYSEKLWGIPCNRLDSDFAAQRIKNFSLYQAILSFFDFLKSSKQKHHTLVNRFAHPTGGSGMVYQRMAELVDLHGELLLNTPIAKVVLDGKKAVGVELLNGEVRRYDHVISSMPITHLVKGIPDCSAKVKEAADSLKFRNTIVTYLNVAKPDLFDDQWLYIHDSRLDVGRITNFRNWAPEICGESQSSIIAMEYWCNTEDEFWRLPDSQLIEKAQKEFEKTGMIDDSSLITDGKVIRVPRCYPVYEVGYKKHLNVIVEYLDQIEGLTAIGRYGSFKYNNQDHSILMGILAVENLEQNCDHDLWDINTDYESYQEDGSTKSLEKAVEPQAVVAANSSV